MAADAYEDLSVTRAHQISELMREALALPMATFACSAMAAGLATAIAWCFAPHASNIRNDYGVVFFLAFAVCLPYVVIVGLPVGLFLVHKRMFRTIPALLAGAIAASPIPLLVIASSFAGPVSYEGIGLSVAFLLLAAVSGALSGLAFYGTHKLMSAGIPGSTLEASQGA